MLSLTSGCVSPQFHCAFDDHFSTIDNKKYDNPWQEKAHFISKTNISEDEINKNDTDILPSARSISHSDQSIYQNVHDMINEESYQPNEDVAVIPQLDTTTTKLLCNAHETREHMSASNENIRRSGRICKRPERYAYYIPTEQLALQAAIISEAEQTANGNNLVAYETLNVSNNPPEENSIVVIKAISDPDTMYLWET
jgi:hypothetical protein